MKTKLLFFIPLFLIGCQPQTNRPEPSVYASEMHTAYLEYFGAYYAQEGLPQVVCAIDCYSDGLKLNKKGVIEGSGTNLYISDIFLPAEQASTPGATMLPVGEYAADTSGNPMTFLPGQMFEGQITGAYLLRIEDDQLVHYTILPSGQLQVRYDGDTAVLHLEAVTAQKQAYTADFRGVMVFQDKSKASKHARSIRL